MNKTLHPRGDLGRQYERPCQRTKNMKNERDSDINLN